ncbi:C39 family peptidase [Candidatus Saccharibacteria bacterium]|nr:C39 family peptidase [Candidatus Saccharibacteria bacterium]MCL1963135.1 C39 family peptidase [Candidatus Saccharibacteria bacterium]
MNTKAQVIPESKDGRRKSVRFVQRYWGTLPKKPKFDFLHQGCAPCSVASILATFGYDISPYDVANLMMFDDGGNVSEFWSGKGFFAPGVKLGIEKLVKDSKYDLEIKDILIDWEDQYALKEQITGLVKNGWMGLINVGKENDSPMTFHTGRGHYLAVSSVSKSGEFYVINPNEIGDNQIDKTFPFEILVDNIRGRKSVVNFLMMRRKM